MQLPQRRSYMDMIQYSIAFCNPQGPLDNGMLLTLAVVKIPSELMHLHSRSVLG